MNCSNEGCTNEATTYFIIEPDSYACDIHASGDYHRELEKELK